jgi:hypothetical protein
VIANAGKTRLGNKFALNCIKGFFWSFSFAVPWACSNSSLTFHGLLSKFSRVRRSSGCG